MKLEYNLMRRNQKTHKQETEVIYFDSKNLVEKFSEKMGPHFIVTSDCKKWVGVSTNGVGIHYVYENK